GDEDADFSITNNIFTGNHFMRIRGEVDFPGGWLTAPAQFPTTVTGNDMSAVSGYLLQVWDSQEREPLTRAYVASLIGNNTLGAYVYAEQEERELRYLDYEEYGGTAPAFFLSKNIQDVVALDVAKSGDSVIIGSGAYTGNVLIETENIALQGEVGAVLS